MESMVLRFKQSLRTNLKIWKDDLNLICISGGSSSMALAALMHESLFAEAVSKRKMFFKVHCLYIDEASVFGLSDEKRHANIDLIRDTCEKFGFTWSVLRLESVFGI